MAAPVDALPVMSAAVEPVGQGGHGFRSVPGGHQSDYAPSVDLGVREDRARCCQVQRLAGLSLFGHRAGAYFGSFGPGRPQSPLSHRLAAGAERFASRFLKSGL